MHASLVSVAVATLVSFALPSPVSASPSSSSSHLAHAARSFSPRHHHAPRGVEFARARSLGSRGKGGPLRLEKRAAGEAVLKCTSAKTFELCDGDRCTDMGSVAAGTMCKDGAITWDTSYEATPEDSSSASSSIVAYVSSKAEQAGISSVSAAVVVPTVKLNAVQSSASSTFTTPAAQSTSTSSSSEDDGSDSEDDWECDADESTSTTSAASRTYTTTPPASSSTSAAAAQVNLNVEAKSSTTTPAASTTTSQAPLVEASASVSTGSSSGGDWIEGGKATFFYQMGGYGACGKIHQDSDKIVALQIDRYGTSSNSNPDCGRQVEVKNDANGKTVIATVADACPGCANYNSLDLSVGAFDAIGDQATGVLSISWKWIS
ncbi:hypothetical protein JCM10212_000485 [Sporobolomyces blumeae]